MKVREGEEEILSYTFKTVSDASEMLHFLKDFLSDATLVIQPLLYWQPDLPFAKDTRVRWRYPHNGASSMNTFAAAQRKPKPEAPPPDWQSSDWYLVLQPRLGKPPLRFRRRCLSRARVQLALGDDVVIGLWQKQKGGFVVSHSIVSDSLGAVDAIAVASVAAAMDYLEGVCAVICSPGSTDLPDVSGIVELITEIARRRSFRQQFQIMAGHVLAQWDAWGATLETDRP